MFAGIRHPLTSRKLELVKNLIQAFIEHWVSGKTTKVINSKIGYSLSSRIIEDIKENDKIRNHDSIYMYLN